MHERPTDGTAHGLDDLERRVLERAVDSAGAEIECDGYVEHERVRAWLLDLVRDLDRPPPAPEQHRRS